MIAAEMLEKHSGGKVSEALRMSMASSSKPGAVNLDMKGSTATPFTNTHSNEAEPNENCATTAAPTATGNSEEIKSSPYLESENDSGPLIDGEISVKEHLKQQYGTTSKAAANNHEMLHHDGNNREGDNIGTSPIPLVPALPQKKGFLCCLGWDPLCSKPDKERKYRLDH